MDEVTTCEGCRKVLVEVKILEDKGDIRHEEYLKKVGEYEADKAVNALDILYIKENIKATMESMNDLSDALVSHMADEMKMHEATNIFMVESKVERRWVSLIGAAIIGVMIWFYTTQYLPSTTETNDGIKTIQIELTKIQQAKGAK